MRRRSPKRSRARPDRGSVDALRWARRPTPHLRPHPVPALSFLVELALLFASHPWSEGDPDQQSFRRQETADGLAPGLFLVPDKHSIAARFKLRRCPFHTVNVELEPG